MTCEAGSSVLPNTKGESDITKRQMDEELMISSRDLAIWGRDEDGKSFVYQRTSLTITLQLNNQRYMLDLP